MRAIEGERKNCITNGVTCAMQEGGRCKYLRMDIVDVVNSPGPFFSLDQLKVTDFKTIIPMLAEGPMTKLNEEAIERSKQSKTISDLRAHEINRSYDHYPTQIPPLRHT